MKLIGKCEKCKRNLVRLNNGNVVCGCTDKAVDEMLRMWAERKERMRKMNEYKYLIQGKTSDAEGCAIDATWIRWLTEGYLKYVEGEK